MRCGIATAGTARLHVFGRPTVADSMTTAPLLAKCTRWTGCVVLCGDTSTIRDERSADVSPPFKSTVMILCMDNPSIAYPDTQRISRRSNPPRHLCILHPAGSGLGMRARRWVGALAADALGAKVLRRVRDQDLVRMGEDKSRAGEASRCRLRVRGLLCSE